MKTHDLSTRLVPGGVPASPIPSFTKLYRTVGSISASGKIFDPNAACTVLWVLVQVTAATTIQLAVDNVPVSPPLNVPAGTVIRFAGTLLPNNSRLSFLLTGTTTANFSVAWIKQFFPEFISHDTAVSFGSSTGTVATVNAALIPGTKATYGAFGSSFTPAATPTDVITVQGDGTHVIRLTRLTLLAQATAAGAPLTVIVAGNSTLDTGGTFASPSLRPIDPNDAAIGTIATVNRYTANPAVLGTAQGVSFVGSLPVNAIGGVTQTPLDIIYGAIPGAKLPTVNNNAQQIVLNFQGAALPAGFVIPFFYVELTLD